MNKIIPNGTLVKVYRNSSIDSRHSIDTLIKIIGYNEEGEHPSTYSFDVIHSKTDVDDLPEYIYCKLVHEFGIIIKGDLKKLYGLLYE